MALGIIVLRTSPMSPVWPLIPMLVNRVFELVLCSLSQLTVLVSVAINALDFDFDGSWPIYDIAGMKI